MKGVFSLILIVKYFSDVYTQYFNPNNNNKDYKIIENFTYNID